MTTRNLVSGLAAAALFLAGSSQLWAASGYRIGGELTGLKAGTSIKLLNRGQDPLTLSADGTFRFAKTYWKGSRYLVTVAAQPTGQTCSVQNGSGTVSANVTNILVACANNTYSIGGTISGLLPGNIVTLQNNVSERIQVSANGTFAFPNRLETGAAYTVIAAIRPNGQTCVVDAGEGTVANTNITTISVNCKGISVKGNRLTKDGQVWTPNGLSMIGSLTCKNQVNIAKAHWGEVELAAARAWGADTLRFQVSQPVLDPENTAPAYNKAAYLNELRNMVALAKANGFAVILSMQDQVFACGDATDFPTQSTVRAWNVLAPVFAHDTMVIYELYNEPQGRAPNDWNIWRNGGGTANDGQTTVGMQQLLNLIRNTYKSDNVILADGLQYAEVLTGVQDYLLSDSRNLTGYAVHPYYMLPPGFESSPDPEGLAHQWWDMRFGFLISSKPVVASEWNANSNKGGCHAVDPLLAKLLLPYLESRGIGIYGWAFDLPGTLIKTDPAGQPWTWTPTDFGLGDPDRWVCGQGELGAGKLLRDWYRAHP